MRSRGGRPREAAHGFAPSQAVEGSRTDSQRATGLVCLLSSGSHRASLAPGSNHSPAGGFRMSACCGDPTPNAAPGECCTSPSGTCSCQSHAKKASTLPVAIIGAGPIGLAAAIHLVDKDETPIVFEAGDAVGASVRQWSHVRLFSPWKYLVDPTMRRMLEQSGWTMPDEDTLPTGGQLIERLLEPISKLPSIEPLIRLNQRVVAITRRGFDKVKSTDRGNSPFEIVVRDVNGTSTRILVRAVIDASGTWTSPNPMGAGGIEADGERELAGSVVYRIPDVQGPDRDRYAGKRVLVVGSR